MGQFDDLARQASGEANSERSSAKTDAANAARILAARIALATPNWKSLGHEIASALRSAKVKPERDPNRMVPGRRFWRTPFGTLRTDGVWLENANRTYMGMGQIVLGMDRPKKNFTTGWRWSVSDVGQLLWDEQPADEGVKSTLRSYIRDSIRA